MKKIRILVIVLGILILIFLAYKLAYKKLKVSNLALEKSNDFEVIHNIDTPKNVNIKLTFELDFSFTEEAWSPYKILADKNNNNFVFADGNPHKIIKFNKQGKEVLRKIFQKGQGPGEFRRIDPCLSKDGKLFLIDPYQRRLTILDQKLEILEIQKLKYWGELHSFDNQDNMYFVKMEFLPKTRDRQKLILTKIPSNGMPMKRFHEYEWGSYRNAINGTIINEGYRPQIKYCLDKNNNLYFAMSDKYEIFVYSPEGELIRKIIKKGKSRKLTSEEIKNIKSKSPTPRIVYKIPNRMPFIADIFVLDNQYLLVITFENNGDDVLDGDLFNEKGEYIARVKVPKYYKWDYLYSPSISKAITKNKYFYTIEYDETKIEFYFRRYRINIREDF